MTAKLDKSELIPVHVSKNEVLFMNEMQKLAIGKSHIEDEHTGLPSYPGLSTVIENPESQRMFRGALHALKTNAQMPPEVSKVYSQTKSKILKKGLGENPIEQEVGIKEIAKAGEGNDKQLVMMPIDVVEFLDKLEGTKKKESKFGLQEFAFFDNVFDIVGSAMYGANQKEHHFWGEAIGGASMLLGAWLNNQADEQEHDQYERERQEQERRKAAVASRWNAGGIKTPVFSVAPVDKYTQHGYKKPAGGNFKKGGIVLGKPIKGPGHGQEDLIHKDIPKNTWIFDAHTVSNFGNGSSDAGHKELDRLYKHAAEILKKNPDVKRKIEIEVNPSTLPMIPCAVANDEGEFKPKGVAALGHGSNNKGAAILRDMTETVRVHKISKGSKLPPPAPDIIDLYKRVARKHGMEA